jgi:2,5-furandicarboxylate decarboxylase 1
MELRTFIARADELGWLRRIHVPVSPELEMAKVIHALGEELVLFENVPGWSSSVVAGICSQRRYLALALAVNETTLLPTLLAALLHPSTPTVVTGAPCQEVVSDDVDMTCLPILTHFVADGGPYVTSAVAVVQTLEFGRNLSFHRLMRVGKRCFTVRLVEGRGLHTAWAQSNGRLPVAMCLGAPPQVQLAASMSPAPGVDEMAIANSLAPTPTVKALGSDLKVPAGTEIVLEGYLTQELGDEGPFIDLTRTRDYIRQQPFFIVERVTHRQNPIFQALLPGGEEHRLLMGMPREPTIFEAVNRVCHCVNVCITSGGGHWLHAVVQIDKRKADDGLLAIEASFRGHSSLKHVVIVDRDIDPYDSQAVEWSIATRFQAGKGLIVLQEQPGSSLDPSAIHTPGQKARTGKMGLDATIPWNTPEGPRLPEDFIPVNYEPCNLTRYVGKAS